MPKTHHRLQGLNITVKVIVNDTVACLLAGNHINPDMRTFVVLGTGLNASVAVPISTVGPIKFAKHPSSWVEDGDCVLVNSEVSLMGDTIFPKTVWDQALIQRLPDGVCVQPLEYLCSGYYIGEIVRLILVQAHQLGCFSSDAVVEMFLEPYSFPASLIAALECERTPDLSVSAALTGSLCLTDSESYSLRDLSIIRSISRSVSLRAAGYVAVVIHSLANFVSISHKNGGSPSKTPGHSVIGVSGALFERLPGFKDQCEEFLKEIARIENEGAISSFELISVKLGSTIGSALAANV